MTTTEASPFADLFIVDADSHWSEPPDLFTSRAPAAVRDRMPRVEEVDGQRMWVFDGHPAVSYTHLTLPTILRV